MTVEELHEELKKIIASLNASGFDTVDEAVVTKIAELCKAADELGLKKGKQLVQNLSDVIIAIKEGKSKAESGILRLTALDFYIQNLSSGNATEDL